MVGNAVKNLPAGKTSVSNDIPVSIMKETIDAYRLKLKQVMNDCLKNNFFPDILKNAEIIPCFKKEIRVKKNYGPISILPNFSKVLERLIYN